jgi:hypothetical protein
MIMVQTTTDYYFYRLGVTQYSNLLYTASSNKTIALLSQTIPQAVLVGNSRSFSYIVSNGYLELIRPKENLTVAVVATSISNGSSVSCSQSFQITTVENTTLAYFLKSPPQNMSLESPAVLEFKLSDYVIGPQLKYDTHVTPGIKYDLKHIEDIDITGLLDGYNYLDALPLSNSTYYRLSQNGANIQIDMCQVKTPTTIECNSLRNVMVDG